MTNEDKMLQLVLADTNLHSYYDFNPNDYTTIEEALNSDNYIVVSIAKIIHRINGSIDRSVQKEVYKEVFNYLNHNIL